jgi:hypothetical protein
MEIAKEIICKQSPYFAATFKGNFKEGEDQLTTLEEIDGVVSTRSFQMLAQWLCLGRVVFSTSTQEEAITATIEFIRLADVCGVTGMESPMAEHIKAVILADPALEPLMGRAPDTNTHSHPSTSFQRHLCLSGIQCAFYWLLQRLKDISAAITTTSILISKRTTFFLLTGAFLSFAGVFVRTGGPNISLAKFVRAASKPMRALIDNVILSKPGEAIYRR